MMGIETIRALNREAGRKAARAKREPFAFADYKRDIPRLPPFPFPNLGDHRPKGWKLADTLFCDSSGWGSPTEPALTAEQLKARLLALETAAEADGRTLGYAIIESGQFQAVLGVFERTAQAPAKRTAVKEHVKPAQVTFHGVPSSDPLAFIAGFSDGYNDTASKGRGLAPEYKRGVKLGREARKTGTLPSYAEVRA